MTEYKLGPERRVKRRREYLELQNKGKKARGRYFLVSHCPTIANRPGRKANEDLLPACENRIGITVTKKVNKRAAHRNRLKRRVREIFRHLRPRIQGYNDIVVIALNGATELSNEQVSRELKYLFYKAKLLPEKKRGNSRGASRSPKH